jgi:hypothetical protein
MSLDFKNFVKIVEFLYKPFPVYFNVNILHKYSAMIKIKKLTSWQY